MSKVSVNLPLLKELRQEKDYSLSDMSALLGYKTPTGFWLVEKGQRSLSVENLYALSRLFNRTMEDLLIVEG